jgi:hypothetical protein
MGKEPVINRGVGSRDLGPLLLNGQVLGKADWDRVVPVGMDLICGNRQAEYRR